MAEDLSLPTRASRKRVLAQQDRGSSWKLKLTPSKRKREGSLSSDSGFGGYGDDSDDLHDEEEIEEWESDGSSSDGIGAYRRVTRQSGPVKPEPMQTRSVSSPSSRSAMLTIKHHIPSSPVASRSTGTRSTGTRETATPAARTRPSARARRSSRTRRASTDFDPTFEEGEDELESNYSSSDSSTPAPKLTKAPTRRILEHHRHVSTRFGPG
jgi:hypothetical protein